MIANHLQKDTYEPSSNLAKGSMFRNSKLQLNLLSNMQIDLNMLVDMCMIEHQKSFIFLQYLDFYDGF